jgi:endonuclease/exonuclease/phosphatase family metal-dependent hydrolase
MRLFQRRLGGRMALISHVELPQRTLVLYNVHLESRGNDSLRCNQLLEIYDDLSQYDSNVPVVVAGDFNADLSQARTAAIVSEMQLNNPFLRASGYPATSLLNGSRTIDWILTRGPLIASEPKMHDSIRASDHFPLSLTLGWK